MNAKIHRKDTCSDLAIPHVAICPANKLLALYYLGKLFSALGLTPLIQLSFEIAYYLGNVMPLAIINKVKELTLSQL